MFLLYAHCQTKQNETKAWEKCTAFTFVHSFAKKYARWVKDVFKRKHRITWKRGVCSLLDMFRVVYETFQRNDGPNGVFFHKFCEAEHLISITTTDRWGHLPRCVNVFAWTEIGKPAFRIRGTVTSLNSVSMAIKYTRWEIVGQVMFVMGTKIDFPSTAMSRRTCT